MTKEQLTALTQEVGLGQAEDKLLLAARPSVRLQQRKHRI